MSSDLQSLAPSEAVDMYINERQAEVSEKTLHNHKYRLDTFLEFCEERGLDDLVDLTGRDLHRYRNWRLDQGITKVTLRGNLATLRVFLEFAARIDAVSNGMRERVVLPEVSPGEAARDVKLDEERAEAIIDYLDRFHYAGREHIIIVILWNTGIRLGSLRAFDVNDFHKDDRYLELHHRPDTGTPLKNGEAAERFISVDAHYAEVIHDYIAHNRINSEDKYGRNPLISSNQGRLSSTAVRNAIYRITRPCTIDGNCPHDRDPDTCEAMEHDHASECPSSRSPHGIRRGSITKHLRDGAPQEVVSDRMNVSADVLDQHYDRRTEREKMEVRRKLLEDE